MKGDPNVTKVLAVFVERFSNVKKEKPFGTCCVHESPEYGRR